MNTSLRGRLALCDVHVDPPFVLASGSRGFSCGFQSQLFIVLASKAGIWTAVTSRRQDLGHANTLLMPIYGSIFTYIYAKDLRPCSRFYVKGIFLMTRDWQPDNIICPWNN